MRSPKYVFVFLFLLLISGKKVMAQSDLLQTLNADFRRYAGNTLKEKLFVHTDKNFYLIGEIIWCKLYYVSGADHKPMNISKLAYVEVLDASNKPVAQAKISLTNGEGGGSLYIPVTMASGNYKLRAYTNWMKNFSADYFFEKQLSIVNTFKNPSTETDTAASYTIDFFPEGGNLVKNFKTKIAFKIADQFGRGVEANGVIVDENKDTVTLFKPLKFGIGNFVFAPSGEHRYKAIVTLPGNRIITKDLPQAYEQGYVMNLESKGDKVSVTVRTNLTPSSDVYLFAHTREMIRVAEKATLQGGNVSFLIDKSQLAEGITQFTLFNTSRQPVCERLYFIRPAQELIIEAKADAAQYGNRKKVNLSVQAKEASGQMAAASMSLSVFQADSLQQVEQGNIVNYLWLTSDLKGPIESPDYYFSGKEEAVDAADNLMLTHGWRRYQWQDVLAGMKASFEFTPEYQGHLITGKVIDVRTGAPARNIQTFLTIPGTLLKFYNYESNDSGRVQFDVKDFYGTGEIIVQTNATKDSTYRIEVFSPFAENYSGNKLLPLALPSKVEPLLLQHSVGMQVQNVYAGDSLQKFGAATLDSLAFYGPADRTYLLDNYTRFATMEEVLREYVLEINVRRRNDKLEMLILDERRKEFFTEGLLVLLDGVPVFDNSKMFSYDPLKVRKLEIMSRRYFLGQAAFNGIANFTTYKGDYEGLPLDPRSIILDYEGLQLKREFYAPVYDTEQQQKSRLPDFRNVLFWSPDIKTDGKQEQQLSFYTSDRKGKYLVLMQAITKDGKAASKYFSFEVR